MAALGILEKVRPYTLSLFRIVIALLFMQHGFQKYFGFPAAGPTMTPLLYVQGIIEIGGGILIFFGAFTRIVAFILCGDAAVAYFLVHIPTSIFPMVNGGELMVFYCFAYLYLVFAGGGAISVDAALKQP